MDAPSSLGIDGAPTAAEPLSPAQRSAVAVGEVAAFLIILCSAFFIYWMVVVAQTYLDEVGGWCGTVLFAIQGQLSGLAPCCLFVMYITFRISIRLGIVSAFVRRCFQAAFISWISVCLGILIGGL